MGETPICSPLCGCFGERQSQSGWDCAGTRLRRMEGSGPALVPLTEQLGGQQLSVRVCVCTSTTCAQPHPEAGEEGDAAVPE